MLLPVTATAFSLSLSLSLSRWLMTFFNFSLLREFPLYVVYTNSYVYICI
jgi:hypothetical protein